MCTQIIQRKHVRWHTGMYDTHIQNIDDWVNVDTSGSVDISLSPGASAKDIVYNFITVRPLQLRW